MARNIVEFGYGNHCTSLCKNGDKLLGAEPLFSKYDGGFPPDNISLDFFKVDEIAIGNYDGECDIHYDSNALEFSYTPFDSGLFLDGVISVASVRCMTLDTWLSYYSEWGFTERIDSMNCVLNGNTADIIFPVFSFKPRPKMISIRQHEIPVLTFDILESLGYDVYMSGDWGIGVGSAGAMMVGV